jgi:hypothetical protein
MSAAIGRRGVAAVPDGGVSIVGSRGMLDEVSKSDRRDSMRWNVAGDDELPRIGGPATRALAAIGVTRLKQVQQRRAGELLALHGVGPRAVGILRSALAEKGVSLRGERARPALPADVQAYVDALDAGHRRLFDHPTTSPDHIEAFRRRHPGFTTNKASIQFRLDDELPADDIRNVIRRATRA